MSANDYILNLFKDKNIKIKLQNFLYRYYFFKIWYKYFDNRLSSYFSAIFFAFFILYIWASAFSIKSSTEVWVSLRNE